MTSVFFLVKCAYWLLWSLALTLGLLVCSVHLVGVKTNVHQQVNWINWIHFEVHMWWTVYHKFFIKCSSSASTRFLTQWFSLKEHLIHFSESVLLNRPFQWTGSKNDPPIHLNHHSINFSQLTAWHLHPFFTVKQIFDAFTVLLWAA